MQTLGSQCLSALTTNCPPALEWLQPTQQKTPTIIPRRTNCTTTSTHNSGYHTACVCVCGFGVGDNHTGIYVTSTCLTVSARVCNPISAIRVRAVYYCYDCSVVAERMLRGAGAFYADADGCPKKATRPAATATATEHARDNDAMTNTRRGSHTHTHARARGNLTRWRTRWRHTERVGRRADVAHTLARAVSSRTDSLILVRWSRPAR